MALKGLANAYYGYRPIYSYFDGCSQGGHQALTEAQRFPKDFNGILAGAPASIMTELNAVLHEYTYAQNYDHSSGTGDYSGSSTSRRRTSFSTPRCRRAIRRWG